VNCATSSSYISNFSIVGQSLNFNSTCASNVSTGYSRYTSNQHGSAASAILDKGTTYTFSVTCLPFDGISAANNIISVWIDYNQNGTFETTEWTQVSTTSVAGVANTVAITIPVTALNGLTGIRVRARASGSPNAAGDACTLFGSGETEDYYIRLVDPLILNSILPVANDDNILVNDNLVLNFNQTMIGAVRTINGNFGGLRTNVATGAGTNTITLNPAVDFYPGEKITLNVPAVGAISSIFSYNRIPYQFNFRAAAGNGTARFTVPSSIASPNITDVEAFDIDNDGDVDYVVTINALDEFANTIRVFSNNGNGTFTNTQNFAAFTDVGLTSGDFDRDGDIDFVTCVPFAANNIDTYANDGTGTFTGNQSSFTSEAFTIAKSADMNGDGFLDIVASNQATSRLFYIPNNAGSSWNSTYVTLPNSTDVNSFVVGDFNGDRLMDVISTRATSSFIRVFLNSTTTPGTFGNPVAYSSGGATALAQGIKAADFDNDGDLDVVLTCPGSNTVIFMRNNGAGVFTTASSVTTTSASPIDIEEADYDGDGDIDLYVAHSAANASLILNNAGTLTLSSNSTGSNPAVICHADFDGDDDIDIVGKSSASITATPITFIQNQNYSTTATSNIPSNLCAGNNALLFWTNSPTTFPAGNIFTIQLSDASGSFSAPTTLGSISSTTATSLLVNIPLGIPTGNGYKFRVNSNISGVTVNESPTFSIDNIIRYTLSVPGNDTTFCVGETVTFNLSDSEIGLSYYLVRVNPDESLTYIDTLAGTGSPLSFTSSNLISGFYFVSGQIGTTGNCLISMNGGFTIIINPDPIIYNTSGGGNICSGGSGLTISLNNSRTGTVYELYNNGVPTGITQNGTNNVALNFTNVNTAGTYTIVATITATGCSATMNGSAVINVFTTPTAFAISAGALNFCSGSNTTISVANSQLNTRYILRRNGTAIDSTLGTGSSITFNNISLAGTYTVLARGITGGCTALMSNNVVITVTPNPTVFNVSGGGNYCSGGTGFPGLNITLSNSTVGVTYTLFRNSVSTGTTLPGTGASISFTNLTVAGTYTIQATSGICTTLMNGSAVINVTTIPTLFTVSGGGSFCSLDAVSVDLSGSQSGVNYVLRRNAVAVDSTIGTGSSLSFNISLPGTYTILAKSSNGLCNNLMTGSAVIILNATPTVFNVTGGGGYCLPNTINIGLSGSQIGVNYELFADGLPTGIILAGTGGALNYSSAAYATGNYTVQATNVSSGCFIDMNGFAGITSNPEPVLAITSRTCAGGGTQMVLNGASTYSWSPAAGLNTTNGNTVTATPTNPTTYNVFAVDANGCSTSRNISVSNNCYCSTVYSNECSSGDFIDSVVFNTLANNLSGCNGNLGNYRAYPNSFPTNTTVTQGSNYFLRVVPGSAFAQGIGVWIDYNQNGSFGDAGEFVFSNPPSTSGSETTVTIPLNAVTGITNMRVKAAYNQTLTAGDFCAPAGFGETEDYKITIIGCTPPTTFNVSGGGVYCSPENNNVFVTLSGSQAGVDYSIFRNGVGITSQGGTGGILTFGPFSTAGNYTILAENSSTGCSAVMNGTAQISTGTNPSVIIVDPAQNGIDIQRNTNISTTYNTALNPSYAGTQGMKLFSNEKAQLESYGSYSLSTPQTIEFNPTVNLFPGEIISVTSPAGVMSASGCASASYFVRSFLTKAAVGPFNFILNQNHVTAATPRNVVTSDFNNDGTRDIAYSMAGNSIRTIKNDGNGNFSAMGTFILGGQVSDLQVIDFDGDGQQDLIYTSPANSRINLIQGFGGGLVSSGFYGTAQTPIALTVNDFDGDGNQDVAVASNATSQIRVHRNPNGDGNLSFENTIVTGGNCTDIVSGDFNLDGRIDLAVLIQSNQEVEIYLNQGINNYPLVQTVATGVLPQNLYVQDFNGDGYLDLATSNLNGGASFEYLTILRFDTGLGLFVTQNISGGPAVGTDCALADFDGDGDIDFVCGNTSSSMVQYDNQGSFNFVGTLLSPGIGNNTGMVASSDFDGDNDIDIAVTDFTDPRVSILLNKSSLTILTDPIAVSPICSGDQFNISYVASGGFLPGNVFTAQLSDPFGSFASPVNIGSVTATTSGNITIDIPLPVAFGSGYRIRVVGSLPNTVGTDNGTNLIMGPLPTTFTVSGGGNYCAGGAGVSINLNGSSSGTVSYELFLNGSPTGNIITGTGAAISFTGITATGNYTIMATDLITGCENEMNANVNVNTNPLPTVFNLGGGGVICSGSNTSITLSGSQNNVNYELFRNGVTTGSILSGPGALSFNNITTAGNYTIVATRPTTGCSSNMNGTTVVTVNPSPTVFALSGGGAICFGDNTTLTLSGSQVGVNYELFNGGVSTGIVLPGTGLALNFTGISLAGNYQVQAENTTTLCISGMSGTAVVTNIGGSFSVFNVSGSGTYCTGNGGGTVSLDGSSSNDSYELYLNGTPTGNILAGNGSALNFSNLLTGGNYTIVATNLVSGCSASMNGTAFVVINTSPSVFNTTGTTSICNGSTTSISLSDSEAGVNYELFRNGVTTGSILAGTGSALSFTGIGINGNFTIVATNTSNACFINMNGTAVITVNPVPNIFNVGGGGTICAGTNGSITLSNSQVNSSYELLLNGNPTGIIQGGTGNLLTFSGITNPGTYTIEATRISNGCTQMMNGSAILNVNPAPGVFNLSGGGIVCAGTNVVLSLSGSQLNVNYALFLNGLTLVETLPGTGAVLNYSPVLSSGNYTVVATNASSCSATMTGTAVVNINPSPTLFNVSGGGSICAGGSGLPVTLSGSETGVSYDLILGGVTLTTINGTGSSINFGNQTGSGTYTVEATYISSGCSANMLGSANIINLPLPTAFTISADPTICIGGTASLTISDSEINVDYELIVDGVNTGITLSGTGSSLLFNNVNQAGNYSVIAYNNLTGCTNLMSNTVTILSTGTPLIFGVSGGGSICPGASTNLGLLFSDDNHEYQLLFNGITPVSAVVTGTNSALNFGSYNTPGFYTVLATDLSFGCTLEFPDTLFINLLSSPPVPVISHASSLTFCTGGSVDLTSSIDPIYAGIVWSTGETTNTITVSTTEVITVTATDTLGCTATSLPISTTEFPALSAASFNITDASCGNSNGSIDLTVNGGTAPYTFAWDNGASTEDISLLAAGPYNVTITDNNGCTSIESVNVNNIGGPTLSITSTPGTCGNSNGSIDLTVIGGTGPFSFAWDNGGNTEDLSGLAAGVYNVVVTDGLGCDAFTGITVSNQTAPTLSAVINDAVCLTDNGSIVLSISGGTAPFTINWSDGSTGLNPVELFAGNYTVNVSDGNGCIANAVYTVNDLGNPVGTFNINNETCSASNGALDLTVTGGTAPYNFVWSNGAITEDVNGLSAGLYDVSITDANGCFGNYSATILNNAGPTLSATQVNASCGANNGSIDLTISGGSAPFTISWSNGSTSEDLSGLAANTYNVTVTDANLCVATTSVTIGNLAGPVLNTSSTDASCGSSNGSIDLTINGGAAPFNILWSNGAVTEDISGLNANTYSVTVTDANFCVANTNVTINNLGGPVLSSTQVDASCGAANGSIDLTITGGTGPFTILWSNGETTEDLINLAANTYSVTLTDASLCVANITVTINSIGGPSGISTTVNNATCGNTNGAITVDNVIGGSGPYNYSFNGGPFSGLNFIAGLGAGTYSVVVQDGFGCIFSTTETINAISGPSGLSFNIVDETCPGLGGEVEVNYTLGAGTLFSITFNGLSSLDTLYTNLAAGTYFVQVLDANGCSVNGSATVGAFAGGYTLTTSTSGATCGNSNGSITVTSVTAGTAPYQYSLDNISFQPSNIFTGLAAGTYDVYVVDANGCGTFVQIIDVDDLASPVLSSTQTDATCGNSDGTIDLTISGGTPPLSILWSNGATSEDLSALAAGPYSVSVTDNNGCNATLAININSAGGPTVSIFSTDDNCGNALGIAGSIPSGGTAPYAYLWSNGDVNSTADSLAAGFYTLTLTDAVGCIASASVTILEFPISLTASSVDESCGLGNGSIDLTVLGGTPAYSFNWDNGATTEDLSGLNAGNYSVIVTDINACADTIAVIINGNPSAILTETHVDANCGLNDGSIDLTVSGTPPFSFVWSNGATTEDINGLSGGTYDVTVTDGNACVSNLSVNINDLTGLALSTSSIDESCSLSNGAIDLSILSGTAPFNINWSNGETTEDIGGLAAGTYTVNISDLNGCSASSTVVIGNTAGPFLSTTQIDETCSTSNGSIDLTVIGGVGPFTFAWDNGAGTEDLSGLTANTYNVLVSDQNGCTASTSVVINNSPGALLTSTATDATCNLANGSIDLTVTGGAAPFSFVWDNGAVTEDISGLIANTYTVTVTDQNLCVSTLAVSVNNVGGPIASTTQINETCSASNGSIDLTVVGGAAPLTILWDNGAITEDISGLSANTYSVIVTDQLGCIASTSVIISNAPTATLSTTQIDETCSAANGSIDLTVSGGVGPFTFAWDNGATTEDISGLAANTYNVTVTDQNACVATTSITLTNVPTATLSTTQIDETCSASNGSIDLTVTGGVGPFSFAWDNGATTEDIFGLAANTYNVTVTDQNACVATTSVTITNAPTATLSTTQVDETCSASNGSIDLTVTGGVGPFTFAWDNGATTEDISGLAANTYNVSVTDQNACVATTSVTITNAPTATLSTTQVDETCSASNGSIDLTVSGGVGPFTFAWDNGATTEDISGLAANTYNVTVTDQNACVATTSVTITNAPTATLSTTQVDETCSASNGSIDLTVTGGVGPFTFAWDNGATTEDISGLAANTYNVTVTDQNACVATTSVTITNAPTATLSTTQVDETCSASNGSIDLTVTGGVGPFTFAWDNGATTEDISGLAANTYNVSVTDQNACVATTSVTITNAPTATLSTTQVDETCSASNGSIDLTVTGGVGPFTFAWDNGATTEDISGLAANTYNVTVTDQNACVATTSVTITNAPTATLSTTQVNETCSASNGSIDLTVTGGVGPFTFAWDNGATTEDISGLAANTYNVTVTDQNACVATTSVTITNAPTATLSTTQIDETCSASNGSIDLTVSGGVGPFTFAWDNGATTEDISGLAANTYNVTVTDQNACVATTSVTLTNAPTATLSTTQVDETCSAANGSIDLTVTGGAGPFTFAWDNGATTEDISGLAANTYHVTVTDQNACVATTSVTITNAPTATLSTTQVDETCSASNGSIDLTVTGGVGPFTFAWDNGATTEDISGLAANTYNVTVTDQNACVATTSVTITNAPTATLSTTQVDETCSASNGSIDLTVTGGVGPFTFAWDNGATTEDISGLAANTYNVTVTDQNACVATTSVTITNAPTATLSTTQVDETCSASNGSIDLTVTGGVGPFTFAWDNGATTEDISGLAANTYNVTVTDQNACVATTSVTITNAPTATLSTTQIDETCSASNGSIDLTVTGGVGPFTFAWDNGATTEDISGLAANTYNVTVTDQNACVATTSVTITNAPTATLSTTQIDETCSASNGSIDLTVTGGVGPFTFAWDNGATTEDIGGLVANTYNVTVTDQNACVATTSVTLTNAPTATLSTTQVDETCSAANGSIDLTVTGGAGPFTFAWDNGATTEDISGLVPNTYNVTVTDLNGCVATTAATILSIGGPTAVALSTYFEICTAANGSVKVNSVSGGTGAFQYSLDGITYSLNDSISGLSANNYTLYVQDANLCVFTQAFSITDLAGPSAATLNTYDETCGSSNGAFQVTSVTGNSSPFLFSTDGITYSALDTLSGLSAQNYNLFIQDTNNCVFAQPFTINNIAGPSATVSVVYDETCTSGNGVLDINGITGGTAPYLYSLDGVTYSANDSLTNFVAGNYTLYVTDVNNCLYTEPFVVANLSGPVAISYNLQTASCGLNVGVIEITSVTGGNGPLTYSTDGINYSANDSITNLAGGAYTIFVSDTNNCIYSEPFTIFATPAVVSSASNDTTLCFGANATLVAAGGTSYSWDNGAGNSASVTVSPVITTLYTVTITDVNNCTATEQVLVNVNALPAAPVISANGSLTFCQGDSVTLTSSYVGGNTWTGGSNLDSLVANTSGDVILTYTDANGCSNEDTVTVVVNPLPIVNMAGPLNICEGSNSIALTAGSPLGGVYSGTGVNAGNFDPVVSGVGTFDIVYTFTDANNCTNSDTTIMVVNGNPILSLTNDSLFFCMGNDVSVLQVASPSGGTYSGTGVNNNEFDPNLAGEGIFGLTYEYTDGNSCTSNIDLVAQVGVLEVEIPDNLTGIEGEQIAVNLSTNYYRATGNFTFSWEPSILFNDPTAENPILITETDTTISVTVSDGYCVANDAARVIVVEPDVIIVLATSNPGSGNYDLIIDNGDNIRDLTAEVFNTNGARLFELVYKINPGKNKVPVDITTLSDGAYFLRVQIGNTVKTLKLAKVQRK
jgi:hypothetical protein